MLFRSQDFIISNTHSNGDIIIGVNGKEKTLIITPDGNIGIGTTLPLGVFDIRGGDLIIPENNRNVGIGITNPNEQLHIHKLNNDNVVVKLSDASNTSGVILKKDSNQDFIISNTHSDGDIIIGVNGKEKTLIITPEGKIGIGTTLPLGVFDIRGGDMLLEGNLYPLNNVSFDLGTSNKRWKDLYLSGNSINLGGLVLSKSSTNNLEDRKSTRLNSSHIPLSRMPSSA